MSFRLSRSQTLLRSLPSSKPGAFTRRLPRTQNAAHLGQSHIRRFRSSYVNALEIIEEPATVEPTSVSDIKVRLAGPRFDDPLTPVVASSIGDSPERILKTSSEALRTCVR